MPAYAARCARRGQSTLASLAWGNAAPPCHDSSATAGRITLANPKKKEGARGGKQARKYRRAKKKGERRSTEALRGKQNNPHTAKAKDTTAEGGDRRRHPAPVCVLVCSVTGSQHRAGCSNHKTKTRPPPLTRAQRATYTVSQNYVESFRSFDILGGEPTRIRFGSNTRACLNHAKGIETGTAPQKKLSCCRLCRLVVRPLHTSALVV